MAVPGDIRQKEIMNGHTRTGFSPFALGISSTRRPSRLFVLASRGQHSPNPEKHKLDLGRGYVEARCDGSDRC